MSLVILSNDASESLRTGQNNSIFKPYSFRNSITSTLEIPENAEVALQSCKITLDGSVAIEGGRRVFYLYLGQVIDPQAGGTGSIPEKIEETLSAPIRYELFNNNNITRDYSVEEIATEITRVLNTQGDISEVSQLALVNAGELRRYTGLFHPDYQNLPGTDLHEVKVKRDATTGESEGYEIVIKFRDGLNDVFTGQAQAAQIAAQQVNLSAQQQQMRTQVVLGGRIAPIPQDHAVTGLTNAATMTPLTAAGFNGNTMGTTFDIDPITLTGGTVTFDLSGCTLSNRGNKFCRFACGLSRVSTTPSITQNGQSTSLLGPRDYNPVAGKNFWRGGQALKPNPVALVTELNWVPCFLDYAVIVSTDGALRVLQCVDGLGGVDTGDFVNDPFVPSGPGGGSLGGYNGHKWMIVNYTVQNAAVPFNGHYDMKTNVGNLFAIKFVTDGAKVSIIGSFNGGGGIGAGDFTLVTFKSDKARITQQLKPIDQGCWNMQPFMMLNLNVLHNPGGGVPAPPTDAADFSIVMTDYKISNVGGGRQRTPSIVPSYYTMLMERNTAQTLREFKSVSTRWKNIAIGAGDLPYPGYTRASHTFEKLRPVLIVAPSAAYSPSPGANVRGLFGFSDMTAEIDSLPPWVADTYDAGQTESSQKISSTSVPKVVSAKSIFVRLDNFNTKSMNAGHGNPSRIIAHLPRFDGQNETGRLFFEPNTLVYVDLHNAQPLKITQLDTSFVYGNESLCTALTGTSVVVLHFRKKQ
tara:strand:+ start:157 stop:2403 length:2247 start_codon:yes stop_codon:yes gene_type:complete